MIPKFLFPLLPYRSFAYPFLVLSAIAVPCWLVFRLYRLRTPGHGLSFYREILLLTFVVYLSGLAVATLIPNHNSRLAAEAAVRIDLHPNLASLTCSSAILPRGSTARAFCLHNAKGNVMLFFPLGILTLWSGGVFVSGGGYRSRLPFQSASKSFSTFRGRGAVDVNDVILNVVGACLGLVLVSLLLRLLQRTRPAVARA